MTLQNNIAKLLFCMAMLGTTIFAGPGDPDTTFGINGTATDSVSSTTVNKVILQPDGKIIVVGKRLMSPGMGLPLKDYLMIRRYTATGALETIFNTTLRQGVGYDAEVQPDGKVVVLGYAPNTVTSPFGGSVSTTSPVVWRFESTGVIDTSFGSYGTRFINAQSGGNFNIELINDRIAILYASRSVIPLGDYSYKVSRLSPTGNVDYTITLPYTYYSFAVVTMKVDPSTSDIVVLASQQLRRYNFDGSVDTSFGTNGVAAVPYCYSVGGLPIASRDLEVQPDGALLVLASYIYNQASVVNLTRQNAGGTPDPSVCKGLTYGPVIGSDLLLQPDGRFFFYIGNPASGVRFFTDGTPATSVSNLTQNPQVIQPDQKLVTARATSSAVILTRQLLD